MIVSSPPPMRVRDAILLVFANDWVDDRRHLRSLLEESKAIGAALSPLVDAGWLAMPPPIHNATASDVLEAFHTPRYRNRICIFHFGGHASTSTLLFEDKAGNPALAHASGLADYLGRQRGLVLVFLNGCCTEPQVRLLRAAGVKAVVATTHAIQDEIAAVFAAAFYIELAERPLKDAFDTAVHAVRMRWGDDPRAVIRDMTLHKEPEVPRWPWVIDCDPSFENWTVRSLAAKESRSRTRNRVLASALIMSLLLLVSAVLNPETRRTMCRAPLIRSLCHALGMGNVPGPAEQAMWEVASTERSGKALRAYLRTYPTGAYASEARSLLAGCWNERIETLGPEKDLRYVLTVSAIYSRPLGTEDEARQDAISRGNHDAALTCDPLRGGASLQSALALPRDWKCSVVGHGYICGFDGEIVCRVRNRMSSEHEHCEVGIK